MTDPQGTRDLLFMLKMQFLALPSLLRGGAIGLAGILLLRHIITLWWEARQARALRSGTLVSALPEPDPFEHSDLDDLRAERTGLRNREERE